MRRVTMRVVDLIEHLQGMDPEGLIYIRHGKQWESLTKWNIGDDYLTDKEDSNCFMLIYNKYGKHKKCRQCVI